MTLESTRSRRRPGGNRIAGRIPLRLWFVVCALAAFLLPASLYVLPSPEGKAFLTGWRGLAIFLAVAVDLAGLLLLRRSPWVRQARPLRAGVQALMGLATVLALATWVTTAVMAPSPPPPVAQKDQRGKPAPAAQPKKPDTAVPATGEAAAKKTEAQPGGSSDTARQAAQPVLRQPVLRQPPPKPPEELSQGEELVRSKCLNCHRYQGYGFGATDDLDQAGKTRTMSWIIQLLRDPVNVGVNRARGLHPTLGDEEIFAIARFLAGRGGQKSEEKPWFGDQTPGISKAELAEAGKKTYDRLNCQGCHKIGGKGGEMGPDLSQEGQKRNAAWIEAFLTDYFTQGSAMPFLAISADEINGLAAYLAGLK